MPSLLCSSRQLLWGSNHTINFQTLVLALPQETCFPNFPIKPQYVTWKFYSPRLSKHLSSMHGQIRTLDAINLQKKVPTHFSMMLKKLSEQPFHIYSELAFIKSLVKNMEIRLSCSFIILKQQRHLSYEIAEVEPCAD